MGSGLPSALGLGLLGAVRVSGGVEEYTHTHACTGVLTCKGTRGGPRVVSRVLHNPFSTLLFETASHQKGSCHLN